MRQLLIERQLANQRPLVNKFYKQQKARGKGKGNENVFVVKVDGQIIAAARLADIAGCCFLTGVQVDSNYQRQGVAKALVSAMLAQLSPEQSCYTFPYQHLTGLYQVLGFSALSEDELPQPLQTRFMRYRGQGRDIIAMCYKKI
ncbi:MAG: N-acetylglutamate synthase-like GNAT family acetyltransferase [Phenylobacterium sp.]|jgi:N-acetylglutamate synthase-like GNAT family acetyltransferase